MFCSTLQHRPVFNETKSLELNEQKESKRCANLYDRSSCGAFFPPIFSVSTQRMIGVSLGWDCCKPPVVVDSKMLENCPQKVKFQRQSYWNLNVCNEPTSELRFAWPVFENYDPFSCSRIRNLHSSLSVHLFPHHTCFCLLCHIDLHAYDLKY